MLKNSTFSLLESCKWRVKMNKPTKVWLTFPWVHNKKVWFRTINQNGDSVFANEPFIYNNSQTKTFRLSYLLHGFPVDGGARAEGDMLVHSEVFNSCMSDFTEFISSDTKMNLHLFWCNPPPPTVELDNGVKCHYHVLIILLIIFRVELVILGVMTQAHIVLSERPPSLFGALMCSSFCLH